MLGIPIAIAAGHHAQELRRGGGLIWRSIRETFERTHRFGVAVHYRSGSESLSMIAER